MKNSFYMSCFNCASFRDKKHLKSMLVKPLSETLCRVKCFHCGYHSCEYYHDDFKKEGEKYTTKSVDNIKIFSITEDTEQFKYLQSRGLYNSIYECKIGINKRYIAFPYYLDGKITGYKMRGIHKRFFVVGKIQSCFNMINVNFNDYIVITEGEIDCMSFMEVGVNNVISVPLGAYINMDLDKFKDAWYTRLYNSIAKSTRIILAVDNDDAGQRLREDLRKLFCNSSLTDFDLHGYKDANDFLLNNKSLFVQECLNIIKG